MKTAHEILDFYVRDVAGYLPRKKRNDVAFELKALLLDELAAKAEQLGRSPDPEMALELLAGFGRPAEAAARYHPRPPLIDPADNHNFLIWTVVGAIVFQAASEENRYAALYWVGLMFLFFSVAAWLRRRRTSERLDWRPKRDLYPEVAGWWSTLLPGLATLVFPFAMYLAPRRWWETVSFGKLVSSGLELSDAFLGSWQRGVTLFALGAVVAIYFAAAVQRGWRRWSRRGLIAANLLVGLMLAGHSRPMMKLLAWRGFDWDNVPWVPFEWESFQVFKSQLANQTAMPIFGAVGGIMLLLSFYAIYQEWARVSPAPSLEGVSTG